MLLLGNEELLGFRINTWLMSAAPGAERPASEVDAIDERGSGTERRRPRGHY